MPLIIFFYVVILKMPMKMTFTSTSTQSKSAPASQTPSVMPMSSVGQVVSGATAMMQFSSLASYNKVRTCGSCGGR
jgi:hypothetical protein